MGMSSGAKKAAREQAKATREAAEAQARQARLAAQAAQSQQEGMIARQRVSDQVRALQEQENVQKVDVEVDAPRTEDEMIDSESGRRRAPREAFRGKPVSGLKL